MLKPRVQIGLSMLAENIPAFHPQPAECTIAELETKVARLQQLVAELLATNQRLRESNHANVGKM